MSKEMAVRRAMVLFLLVASLGGSANAAPPDNDDPAGATIISEFPVTIEGDTTEATTGPYEEECYRTGLLITGVQLPTEAVWFRLDIPSETEGLRIVHDGSADVVLWTSAGSTSSGPVLSRWSCAYGDPYPIYVPSGPIYMSVGRTPIGGDGPFSVEVEIYEEVLIENDVPYRATEISSLPYEVEQDTYDARYDNDPLGCPQGAYVWYRYTPAAAETIDIAVANLDDYSYATVAVYALGTEVVTLGCDDAYGESAHVTTPVEAGVPVLIGIGADGLLELSVQVGDDLPPTLPDARADAQPLPLGATLAFDTTGATLEPGEPDSCGSGGSIWFELPPRPRGTVVTVTGQVSTAAVADTVVACSTDGELELPASSPATHIQLRSSTSTTGTVGLSFSPAFGLQVTDGSPFDPGCGNPSDAPFIDSEVEVHQTVDPNDPNHLVMAWQQDRYPDRGGARGIGAAASFDGGETWTTSTIPGLSVCTGGPFERATDPWTAIGPDGTTYLMSLAYSPGPHDLVNLTNALMVSRSYDGGLTWDEPSIVAASPGVLLNDKETLTADPNTPGLLYAVWNLWPTNVAVPVFSRSEDGGFTWTPPVPLPVTGSGTGDQIAVLDDGTVVEITNRGWVQSITSHDRGTTWSDPVAVGPGGTGYEGPPGVRGGAYIPSVYTDGASVFVSWSDTYATYFGRSDDAGATWDLSIVGGTAFDYPPRRFTTAVASEGPDDVTVLTYVLGDDFTARLMLGTSTDGGATWSEQPITDPFDMGRAPHSVGRGAFLGDYFALTPVEGGLITAFTAVPPGDEDGVSNVYSLRLPT